MEHGPLKMYWAKWPTVIILFAIGCLGCFLLDAIAGGGETSKRIAESDDLFVKCFMWGIPIVFILFGFIGSIFNYLKGLTYYRWSDIPLEELEWLHELSYGFLAVYNDKHIVIRYNADKIKERGCIRMLSKFDRHKVLQEWSLMEG